VAECTRDHPVSLRTCTDMVVRVTTKRYLSALSTPLAMQHTSEG